MQLHELKWRPYRANDEYLVAEIGEHIIYHKVDDPHSGYIIFLDCKEGTHNDAKRFDVCDTALEAQCLIYELLKK
jgi:bifunctional pyridoxal-dependent enzyme with beta-cystathionase and maltose regulon repressor activities